MKIGINLLAMSPKKSGGIFIYAKSLIKHLSKMDCSNEYYLFTNRENEREFDVGNSKLLSNIFINIGTKPQFKRIIWEQLILPIYIRRLKLDVIHSLSYTLPILAGGHRVITICDMLYKVHPEYINLIKKMYWRIFVPISACRCQKIITISENSKNDISRYLNVKREKIVVTSLALNDDLAKVKMPAQEEVEAVCRRQGLSRPYILSVGGIGKHKNPFCLIKAFEIVYKRPEMREFSLVISGNDYGIKEEVIRLIKKRNLEHDVILPGYIDTKDLPAIYSGAEAYICPSYFEGFGLPLLEAMHYGIPIVASNKSSIPEVAGDAAIYVDPNNPEQLADVIYEVISNSELRKKMISRGYARVKEFSWEKTARLTLEAYEEAVSGG